MSCSRKKLFVIFPAAGSGTRMRSDKNKLLMEVDGIPVIDRTVSAFRRFAGDNEIELEGILVVTPGKLDEWQDYIRDKEDFKFIKKIVEGGSSRTESVSHGVFSLEDIKKDDIVFIHDAARWLIDSDSLLRCFEAMQDENTLVAVSGVKTKNTIKMIRKNSDSENKDQVIVESTPDRSLLYEVQTPQCFKYGCLIDCYDKAIKNNIEATDDTALAEILGYEVRIVEGSYANIKITTPEDIGIAKALLSSF